MRLPRFRGTIEQPGLMMSIDRGGSCRGIAQRIIARHVEERLDQLVRREHSVKPSSHRPIWVTLDSSQGRRRAIAFASNPKGPNYVADHSFEETAQILASACGHWGTCAEYLMQTVRHLEELGIHDPYLWRLQERVAAIIKSYEPSA
jgi:cation transport protein ChaC